MYAILKWFKTTCHFNLKGYKFISLISFLMQAYIINFFTYINFIKLCDHYNYFQFFSEPIVVLKMWKTMRESKWNIKNVILKKVGILKDLKDLKDFRIFKS